MTKGYITSCLYERLCNQGKKITIHVQNVVATSRGLESDI